MVFSFARAQIPCAINLERDKMFLLGENRFAPTITILNNRKKQLESGDSKKCHIEVSTKIIPLELYDRMN